MIIFEKYWKPLLISFQDGKKLEEGGCFVLIFRTSFLV